LYLPSRLRCTVQLYECEYSYSVQSYNIVLALRGQPLCVFTPGHTG